MSHFTRHARAIAFPVWPSGPQFVRPRQAPRIRRLAGHGHPPMGHAGIQSAELEHRPLPDAPGFAMLVIMLLALACFLVTRPFVRM